MREREKKVTVNGLNRNTTIVFAYIGAWFQFRILDICATYTKITLVSIYWTRYDYPDVMKWPFILQ